MFEFLPFLVIISLYHSHSTFLIPSFNKYFLRAYMNCNTHCGSKRCLGLQYFWQLIHCMIGVIRYHLYLESTSFWTGCCDNRHKLGHSIHYPLQCEKKEPNSNKIKSLDSGAILPEFETWPLSVTCCVIL